MAKPPCRNFAAGRCHYGAKCKYSHDAQSATSSNSRHNGSHAHESSRSRPRREATGSEKAFKEWHYSVPKDARAASTAKKLSEHDLSAFLQEANRLVGSEPGVMQAVISTLAGDGGLFRLRQLLTQGYENMTDTTLNRLWQTQLLPFFQIISHEDVCRSFVAEVDHAGILRAVYGIDGSRAVTLFNAAVRYLSDDTSGRQPDIEVCVMAFAEMLKKIPASLANDALQPTAPALIALINEQTKYIRAIDRARRVICDSLKLAESLPLVDDQALSKKKVAPQTAVFKIDQDLPGELSRNGVRHDNDSADIDDIEILPTIAEIRSARLEYLPHEDPSTWHLPGLAGLIDRHFRLIREDTVGQLRDAASIELERMLEPGKNNPKKQEAMRTNVYRNAQLHEVVFDRFRGLLFVLSSEQPKKMLDKSRNQRRAWWQESNRLASDSLICLLSSAGRATFLQVASPMTFRPKDGEEPEEPVHEKYNLAGASGSGVGFVITHLTTEDPSAAVEFIKACSTYEPDAQREIVEFPGVLLPAFGPTLEALQHMSTTLDVPFADILVPGEAKNEMKPPAFSMRPGFHYSLRSLLRDDQSSEYQLPGTNVKHDQHIQAVLSKSELDVTQQKAIQHALTHSMALIQGPPGTGKSYTGVKLIKALLENRSDAKLGPIICVCYTNHALDQLLESLVNANVEQIVRIGSRSKSEQLARVNLREIARTSERTKEEGREAWQAHDSIERGGEEISDSLATLSKILSQDEISLGKHLKANYTAAHSFIFRDRSHDGKNDEHKDGFTTVQHRKARRPLDAWLRGDEKRVGMLDRPLNVLKRARQEDFGDMSKSERRALYVAWMDEVTLNVYKKLRLQLSSHYDAKETLDDIRAEVDLRVLSGAQIIGITTTGLARSLNTLRRLNSKVLVVEEAGEVLEAHLLTAMLPSLEHAIFIGDHQQLRPKVQKYALSVEKPGNQIALDVSLFERLIHPRIQDSDDGLPYITLETQRRMHPSISKLIRSTLYPNLKDAASVLIYPEVTGMRQRLFWLDHNRKEDKADEDEKTTSHTNEFEVDMVTSLVHHLVRQGEYAAEDIAVLTPYLGQLSKLRRKLGESMGIVLNERDVDDLAREGITEGAGSAVFANPARASSIAKGNLLQAVRIATIDNFQGEEAKVVIISLVRSNSQHKCGFLRTPNRINVLLSRAKHGMYIIGNAATSAHVPMWKNVLEILKAEGNFGEELELCCPRHPETPLKVDEPEQFAIISPEGGCGLMCGKQLNCGHACPTTCHSETLHDAVYCHKDCNRLKEGCTHPCKRACGDKCDEKCLETVSCDVQLECGHRVAEMLCWQYQDTAKYECEVLVQKAVPGCGHTVTVPCCTPLGGMVYQCREPCGSDLDCGHACSKKCYQCRSKNIFGRVGEPEHGKCTKICGRNYTSCEHTCQSPCHSGNCEPCSAKCSVRCAHSSCKKKCSEPCTPCAESKCPSACPHSQCEMPCAAPCDWCPCNKRCEKLLSCGHQCPSLCGEACPSSEYCQKCASDEIKDIRADVLMMETYREVDLDLTPCVFLPCGHIFTVESLDGLMDMGLHYATDAEGRPVAVKGESEPFSVDQPKNCPDCRGSLRTIARYGRIVRRALLDINTKKFITSSNHTYTQLAKELQKQQAALKETADAFRLRGEIQFTGQNVPDELTRPATMYRDRYKALAKLHIDIYHHFKKVGKEEQPYQKVRNLVIATRRRQEEDSSKIPDFEFDQSVLQVRGQLVAKALLLRCDLIMATDLLSLYWKLALVPRGLVRLAVNFKKYREDCETLLELAESSMNVLQQAEAYIFWAQFAALEYSIKSDDEGLKQQAGERLDQAQELFEKYPSITANVKDELAAVRKMLSDTTISNAEMQMVVTAMEREFSGTGHWYRCANGHPFTVGECGGPMQASTCPQCGAPVGGRNHRAAEGVTAARDIEQQFGGMRI